MAAERTPFLSDPVHGLVNQAHLKTCEPQHDVEALVHMSKLQQALWIDYLGKPWGTHYNLVLRIDFGEGPPESGHLIQVIQQLTKQHPSLRSTFHLPTGTNCLSDSYMAIYQAGKSSANIEIIYDDKHIAQAVRREFRLSEEYPVRWVLLQKMASGSTIHNFVTLFVVAHHIAVDGTSMSGLSNSILRMCEGPLGVSNSNRNVGSVGEYVQQYGAYLQSKLAEGAKSFWLSQLVNCGSTEWRAKQPLIPADTYRVMSTWAFFSNEELSGWSQRYKTSWFRVAISVICLIVTGASDSSPHLDQAIMVAFGARPNGFEECVSHMANTLPIKVPVTSILSGDLAFTQLVKLVSTTISSGKRNELFPFLSLIDEARKTMDASLLDFKVAVTFSPKLADRRCTLYPVEGVIYNPSKFDSKIISDFESQFKETVKLSQSADDFHVLNLSFLKNSGCGELLDGPGLMDANGIGSSRVHQWIQARALAQPQAIALHSAEKCCSMSYLELNDRSNQLAHYLRAKFIKPNSVVILYMKRSFDTILWILSILKAGGCYVVLDQTFPINRKRAILVTAEPTFLVTDAARFDEGLLESLLVKPDIIETTNANLDAQRFPTSGVLENAKSNNDLAYMIFTSGSTGQPKGVMVEHASLSHYVSACREYVKIGPKSRLLQFASFSFDAHILEWAVTLSFGGTLCFVNVPSLVVGDYLVEVIELNKINFLHLSPSVLATVPYDRRLSSLQLISVGGEPSSAGLLQKWSRRATLLHAYGPTERTVIVTIERIPRDEKDTTVIPSIIGNSLANSKILIYDEDNDKSLPYGEVGEICIAGPQVTRGYIGQPDLTSIKFKTIEHDGQPTRIYRSGDRGTLDSKGRLSILGRMGHREVKLRGFRIDLGEIENQILKGNSDVMMVSVQKQGDILLAYVVPSDVDCAKAMHLIAQDVPPYSMPARIIAVNELPMNSNGKIDHRLVGLLNPGDVENDKLTLANIDKKQVPLSHIPMENKPLLSISKIGLETIISNLWMEVLSLDKPPSIDVTFFQAGGHSILLNQLHRRLCNEINGAELSLLDVFRNPTIAMQTVHIAKDLESKALAFTTSLPTTVPIIDPHRRQRTSHDADFGASGRMAIVGMAGRFPGSDDIQGFWDILTRQQECLHENTLSRAASSDEDEQFIPRYGLLDEVGAFNAQFWQLGEDEARDLDPQKRIFLEVALEVLQDANIRTSRSHAKNIGVFVGEAHNSYLHATTSCHGSSFQRRYRSLLDPNISTFSAYHLHLNGPNMTINTACASSLVALHQAINSIQANECDSALVGGVSISFPQIGGYYSSEGGVFSPTGRCRPLDVSSDGSVPADAVAAVMIKPLEAAIAAKDFIYSIIEGSAIGTDVSIDKLGFTVPSSTGQAETILKAIKNSSMLCEQVKYVELHGSGTPIGDPLEVQGLVTAFNKLHQANADLTLTRSRIALGSNKGNFGNTEAASGLLSLIKASLAVSKGIMPPLQTWTAANPLIPFASMMFYPLETHLTLSTTDRVLVTALGYGGTNAHCVIASPAAYGVHCSHKTAQADNLFGKMNRKIFMAPGLVPMVTSTEHHDEKNRRDVPQSFVI